MKKILKSLFLSDKTLKKCLLHKSKNVTDEKGLRIGTLTNFQPDLTKKKSVNLGCGDGGHRLVLTLLELTPSWVPDPYFFFGTKIFSLNSGV